MGHVLVTGASAGIGREIARVAAEKGLDLVLVARRTERLEELAEEIRAANGVDALVLAADLADPGAADAVHAWVEERGLEIDVLVNNAGFGSHGLFADASPERNRDMLRVNAESLVALTHRFLPPMLDRGRGRILNVASTAGFQPSAFMAMYFATKAFVLHLTEGLASELRGTGVTATALCPGPVRTEFHEVAGIRSGRFPPGVSAPRVARCGWRAMERGRVIVVPGLVNRMLIFLVRLMPRFVVRATMRGIQTKLLARKS
jgi:short-subunit dehydrogenase